MGRAELMAGMCFFLAMLCYMRACDEAASWWKMMCLLSCTVLLVTCALLFKEQGITAVVKCNFSVAVSICLTNFSCMQGVCIIYDIIVNMKADPWDLLRLQVLFSREL